MTTSLIVRARFGVALLAALGLAGGLYGCDSNAWSDLPTGGGNSTRDETEPQVAIVAPDSTGRVAVGDSVLIRVEVSDDAGIDSVRLSGFALRGSPELGTQTRVERFVTKTVDLSRLVDAVRDTTVARYLLASSDSLAEDVVYLTATARDVAGNLHADTVVISIGGPRLEVVTPTQGSTIRAGTELAVRLVAADSIGRIESLGVQLLGDGVDILQELEIDPAAARVDTILAVEVPMDASGQLELRAFAQTMTNDSSLSTPLLLEVSAAGGDDAPPQVSFTVSDVGRKEMDDTVTITVSATDSTQVERLGATVKASLRFHSSTQVLPVRVEEAEGDSAEFTIALSDLGAVEPADTSYVLRLEVTAFAVDTAGNCATATVPGTPLSQVCSPAAPAEGTEVASAGPGSRVDMVIVRGATTSVPVPSDRLVDLVADSARRRVYVSNLSRNRVEVLGFGADAFGAPVNVGSEPWGLAIGRSRDTMFVANSGGTNISVVPLTAATLTETARINTSNIRLYSFEYDVKSDSVSAMSEHDYSDRPQFLGQVASGQLLYSTKPTEASADGTVRIFDATKDTTRAYNRGSEVVTQYARDGKSAGKGVVVNALEVDLSDGMLVIWPRRLLGAGTDPDPVVDFPTALEDSLAVLRAAGLTDTRIDFYVDIADVGLTDTTFVAVSRDHSAIAFGEGAVNPGRIFFFQNQGGALVGSTTNTDDLVGNAAERVVGLSLNGDGSLGIARGSQSYFFDRNLRLQGVVASGQPSGGVVLHPLNTGYPTGANRRVGFVSGVDSSGRPYVDVVDSYSFRRIRRIPVREPITGTMTAVAVGAADPAYGTHVLRLFGITAGGVVEIGLSEGDLN